MDTDEPTRAELEDRLKEAERSVAELKAERDEARNLAQRMEEHVADAGAVLADWREAFEMQLNDAGEWSWHENIAAKYDALKTRYLDLLGDWNKFVPRYNAIVAPKITEPGRPLDASPTQCAKVLKLRKGGASLRAIADETSLGLQTVRTIIGRQAQTDRTWARRLQKIDPDKAATNSWKARKRTRDALPARIDEMVSKGAALLREAKGLE